MSEKLLLTKEPVLYLRGISAAKVSVDNARNVAVASFLAEYRQGTQETPIPMSHGGYERAWFMGDRPVAFLCCEARFNPAPWDASVNLHHIRTEERRKGYASACLDWICQLADKHGVEIDLFVEATARKNALKKSELIAWYQRHGFEIGTSTCHMSRSPLSAERTHEH